MRPLDHIRAERERLDRDQVAFHELCLEAVNDGIPLRHVARAGGVSDTAIYNWRNKARE